MTVDVRSLLADPGTLPERTPSEVARAMQGSEILAIAWDVKARQAAGHDIANFTVGDFSPDQFGVPQAFKDRQTEALRRGLTNYPPPNGLPELREAVRSSLERDLGLVYPEGCIQIASGARPPIYAAFYCLVSPGDTVVYQVPSWNIHYYVALTGARGVPLVAEREHGFLVTAGDILPHLREARLLCLNTPQNPGGTVARPEQLGAICDAVVAENRRRDATGERPLYLLYDMIYWRLVYGGLEHVTPPGLVPEMARYTILVDGISKWLAGTGVRVGWAVSPPWLCAKMTQLEGHMGAWASKSAQWATAQLLNDPDTLDPWVASFREQLRQRLAALSDGLNTLRAEGLPVEALAPEGAIYLSVRFDLLGKRLNGQVLDSPEAIRSALLTEAGTAVVPFTAFGYPDGTGWMRYSVGATSLADIEASLARTRAVLERIEA